MLIAHTFAFMRATFTPGTMRSRSGMLVYPDRRMSSCVMTKTAAPVVHSFSSFLETDVTLTFNRSSRLALLRSLGGVGDGFGGESCAASGSHSSAKLAIRLILEIRFINRPRRAVCTARLTRLIDAPMGYLAGHFAPRN